MKQPNQFRALLKISIAVIFGIALLGGLERLYVVYGHGYPRWLAAGELGDVDMADMLELRQTACKDPIELFPKDDFVVLRCGFSWFEPATNTFMAKSFSPADCGRDNRGPDRRSSQSIFHDVAGRRHRIGNLMGIQRHRSTRTHVRVCGPVPQRNRRTAQRRVGRMKRRSALSIFSASPRGQRVALFAIGATFGGCLAGP